MKANLDRVLLWPQHSLGCRYANEGPAALAGGSAWPGVSHPHVRFSKPGHLLRALAAAGAEQLQEALPVTLTPVSRRAGESLL